MGLAETIKTIYSDGFSGGTTIGLSFLSIEAPMVPLQVHSCQRKVSP